MIRRTPRATRTDTRFADTTLFRSTEGPGSGRPICGCVGRTAASGGFSSCRFPLAAFEGPDQQPRPADRHDERAPGCDAQQRIVDVGALVIIHDVEHPDEVEDAP